MELEKTKRVNDLIDLYGSLLTENQLNILEYAIQITKINMLIIIILIKLNL